MRGAGQGRSKQRKWKVDSGEEGLGLVDWMGVKRVLAIREVGLQEATQLA